MLFTIICCLLPTQSFSSKYYRIQIGAFVKKIPFTHFAFSGISDVYLDIDKNNIHHYYLRTTFEEYPVANRMKDSLIVRGFPNAIVITLLKGGILSKEGKALSSTLPKEQNGFSKVILYQSDEYKLTRAAKKELIGLIKQLKKYPELKIAVIGHTDAKGNAIYNIALSKNRVRAIKNYLTSKWVSKDQIIAKACGEAYPQVANTNEYGVDLPENRKLNRRVLLLSLNEKGEVISKMSNRQTVHPILEREPLRY
jgi:outer membrane protein OmpA-like peptidoglycan-associated protein